MHRCYGAGLCYQHGAGWHSEVWERSNCQKAGPVLEAYCDSVEKTRAKDQKRQASEHYKEIRRKSKVTQSTTGPSNDYGLNASHEDIDPNELHKLCEENSKRANLSPEEIIRMELQTRGQSNCPLWHQLRKQRLIGEICKRRKSTPCARLVVEILYPRPISSESLRWGTENEKNSLRRVLQRIWEFGSTSRVIYL